MHRQLEAAARCATFALLLLAMISPAYAVDGVTEINQVRAAAGGVTPGDTPGFPVTLDHAGSYRLTGNLIVSDPNTTAITVTVGNVTIDLNGFEIACNTNPEPCGSGGGTGIQADQDNVTVMNGTVRDMGSDGINIGTHARVERVRMLGNHHNGVGARSGSMLINNIANNNGYDGLGAGIGTTVIGNTTRNNGRGGMELNTSCTVSQNTANDNVVFGIYCNGGCTIDRNTLNNNGTGVSMLGGNTVIGNTAQNNTNFALVAIGDDTGYTGNTFTGNNGGGNAAQVSGGTPLGSNFCGTDTTCP